MISAYFEEMCYLEESYEYMQKKSTCDNFESALYMKSLKMLCVDLWSWCIIKVLEQTGFLQSFGDNISDNNNLCLLPEFEDSKWPNVLILINKP